MKKILTIFAILFVCSTVVSAEEAFGQNTRQTTQSIINQMRDAISKDVQNTVDNAVNAGVNGIKLVSYKAELVQKKNELKQVEESNDNIFSKSYQKFKLNQEIKDLEKKISALEKQMHY